MKRDSGEVTNGQVQAFAKMTTQESDCGKHEDLHCQRASVNLSPCSVHQNRTVWGASILPIAKS